MNENSYEGWLVGVSVKDLDIDSDEVKAILDSIKFEIK